MFFLFGFSLTEGAIVSIFNVQLGLAASTTVDVATSRNNKEVTYKKSMTRV